MTRPLIGFDPGRDKCGVALVAPEDLRPLRHEVVAADAAISTLIAWVRADGPARLVMGDGTTTRQWQQTLARALPEIEISLVDERNSTLEARDRYWQMYPPRGLQRLLPMGLRQPSRPVDDIVAILLVERYLQSPTRIP